MRSIEDFEVSVIMSVVAIAVVLAKNSVLAIPTCNTGTYNSQHVVK